MRNRFASLISLLSLSFLLSCQTHANSQYTFEPTSKFPFGQANPSGPEQIKDFDDLIGESQCQSTARNPDGSWQKAETIVWRFKYIMNGLGVQDETLKPDGSHSGSIRQFIADKKKWYVHYYSSSAPTTVLSAWEGNKTEAGEIVLYREQKAPNGMEGFYKITFKDISESKFDWLGEWVNKDESIKYPTWKIDCKKIISG